MAKVSGLECVRCGTLYPPDHHARDCPACRAAGAPSNLAVAYAEAVRAKRARPGPQAGPGLWRYGDVLPVNADEAVSLGEGFSPLHRLATTGRAIGIEHFYAKDETRNPTWSFKDRLACIAVSTAKRMGAPAIVSSSTGNAGAAAAAYAAKAGIPCVVFTVQDAAGPMMTQMRAYGATVVAVADKAERWPLMEHGVRHYGWFPTSPFFGPVVGSNPYGIEGYKTLAYEIVEQLGWTVPDCCILPVCYGDALIGMWRGFEDMRAFGWTDRSPRMIAAEIYGSVGTALARQTDALPDMPRTHDTVAKSITATQGTFQALDTVRRSDGAAISVGNGEIMAWQQRLAREEGLYIEPSAAAAIVGAQKLREAGTIGAKDRVVALLTASGLKDPAATSAVQGDLLLAPGDAAATYAMLERTIGLAKTATY